MQIDFRPSPVHSATPLFVLDEPLTISEILRRAEAPDWFYEFGAIKIGGHLVPKENWNRTTVKPVDGLLELCVVQQGKNIIPILATVAAVVLTAGIAAGGIAAAFGVAGGIFGAGGIGSALAATAVGLGSQLLITALTAPPRAGQQDEGKQGRQIAEAGINANAATPWATLPVIFGKIGTSPPLLAPTWSSWDGDSVTVHAAVGVQGRCQISNILLNGLSVSNFSNVDLETFDGGPTDAVPAFCNKTVIEQRDGITLSSFRTIKSSDTNDPLDNQENPNASKPDFHYFKTDGNWTAATIRLLFPSGIVDDVGGKGVVPIRIQARKVGDTAWRNFPVAHIYDEAAGRGSLMTELRIHRKMQPSGRHFSFAQDLYPVFELTAQTGIGQAFAYEADPYFIHGSVNATSLVPGMTGPTTSGWTVASSSEKPGSEAWKAFDSNTSSYWSPNDNALPAWITISPPVPTRFRSYTFFSGDITPPTPFSQFSPTQIYFEGSNDGGATWVRLDSGIASVKDLVLGYWHGQIENPGFYSTYRINFLDNGGGANKELRVGYLALHSYDALGCSNQLFSAHNFSHGNYSYFLIPSGVARCRYASSTKSGADFYLDPGQWPAGQYEFRIMRGITFRYSLFYTYHYSYDSFSSNADFFEWRFVNGKYVVFQGQKTQRSDCQVDVFQTIEDGAAPFNHNGVAMISISAEATQINSIYAVFQSYARHRAASLWNGVPVTSQNPAALYREVLLGYGNPDPVPGEIIDEDSLTDWYFRCAAAGHQCNAVVQGQSVADTLQMLASCGYASPRMSEQWGVVQDYDTSALPSQLPISPLNSKDQGTSIILPKTPHVVQVEFFDETDSYKARQTMIYAEGYDANNATLVETWRLPGITSEAKAIARATHDLRQSAARKARYSRQVGLDGFLVRRGDVVSLTDDVIDRKNGFGIIMSVTRVSGNVTRIELDNVVPLSAGRDDITGFDDVLSVTNVLADDMALSAAIQFPDGSTSIRQISNITDGSTLIFSPGFADGGATVPGLLVMTGLSGRETRRCRVMSVTPSGIDTRVLELADETPEIFT